MAELDLPTGGFTSGPATAPLGLPTARFTAVPATAHPPSTAPPPTTTAPPVSSPPAAPTTPSPVTPGTVDPRQALAELLAPVPGQPLLRKGRVVSVDTASPMWSAYITVDGTDERPRRAGWNGNGSKPAVGDFVYYYNISPMPLIVGRMPTANQDQDFGSGTVTGGDFVDSGGSIRTDITSNSSQISSLSSTVSSHTSSISSLNSTVSSHTSTLSSHTSSINSLNSTVSGHTTTINSHTSSIATINVRLNNIELVAGPSPLNNAVYDLLNRMANAEARLTAGGH